MAGLYVGVSGVSRKVNNMYVGVGNVARKVIAGYVGVGGVARKFWPGRLTSIDNALTGHARGAAGKVGDYAVLAGGITSVTGVSSTVEAWNTSGIRQTVGSINATQSPGYLVFNDSLLVYGGYRKYNGNSSDDLVKSVAIISSSLSITTQSLSSGYASPNSTHNNSYAIFYGGRISATSWNYATGAAYNTSFSGTMMYMKGGFGGGAGGRFGYNSNGYYAGVFGGRSQGGALVNTAHYYNTSLVLTEMSALSNLASGGDFTAAEYSTTTDSSVYIGRAENTYVYRLSAGGSFSAATALSATSTYQFGCGMGTSAILGGDSTLHRYTGSSSRTAYSLPKALDYGALLCPLTDELLLCYVGGLLTSIFGETFGLYTDGEIIL